MSLCDRRHSIVSVSDRGMLLLEIMPSMALRRPPRTIQPSGISQEVVSRQDGTISLSDTIPRSHHELHPISSISEIGSMEMGEKYPLEKPVLDQGYICSMSNEDLSIVPRDCVSMTHVSQIGQIFSMLSVVQEMLSQNGMQQELDSLLLVSSKMVLISSFRLDLFSR